MQVVALRIRPPSSTSCWGWRVTRSKTSRPAINRRSGDVTADDTDIIRAVDLFRLDGHSRSGAARPDVAWQCLATGGA